MSWRSVFALVAVLCIADLSVADEEPSQVLRAGAATSNITPPLGEKIVGGWEPIPATNIHDELHARCLALSDGDVTLAFAICDNVGIPIEVFEAAKEQLHKATSLPKSNMLFASTHTHSATTARNENGKAIRNESLTGYQAFLAQRISDGVRRAIANMQPAEIAWGRAEEPSEVFNRRWYVTNASLLNNPFGGVDQVRMNPPSGNEALDRPAGPTDPEISFLSLRSIQGRPIALLANYSLHYVGGVNKGDVSADYFGYFARRMESELGGESSKAGEDTPPFVGILTNGTSGDINNINFTLRKKPSYAAYEKMREVADKVADRVLEAHSQIEFKTDVKLEAMATNLTLKVRQPTPEMLEHFARVRANPNTEASHRREAIYAKRVDAILKSPKRIDVPLQAFRIGELGIVAIPFETFAETGLEIKDQSPLKPTFTIELAGGSFGYLPTPEQHRLGGYETWLGTNYVEKQASRKIVAELMKMLQSLSSN